MKKPIVHESVTASLYAKTITYLLNVFLYTLYEYVIELYINVLKIFICRSENETDVVNEFSVANFHYSYSISLFYPKSRTRIHEIPWSIEH